MSHFPNDARDRVAHLRVGILSLPGVSERGFQDSKTGNYSIHFYLGEDALFEAHSHEAVRVILDFMPEDARSILDRRDLSSLRFEPWSQEGTRKALEEMLVGSEREEGPVHIDLALRSQDDLRSFIRLVHAKYDAMIAH